MLIFGADTLDSFSAIYYKGDSFWEFRFVFIHTKPILKVNPLLSVKKNK